MDLFDVIPKNFFSILSSKNMKLYIASILETFKIYENASIMGIDRKTVVDELAYFLETHSYDLDDNDDEDIDEDEEIVTKRDLANLVIRKLKKCGWIYTDITNEYEEIINFTDPAMVICEALLKMVPKFELGSDEYVEEYLNVDEYQGYIYQIYCILNQENKSDYSMLFSLVYSNTKQLIRALRRLDSRLKDYITSVIDKTDVKDLMETLMIYNTNIFDPIYKKLKISDNINRYRLSILTNLEEIEQNEVAVKEIAKGYTGVVDEYSINKAIKNIDDVVDAFNAIDGIISEIDNKNKTYINSTIGKIKFLLSDDDNMIGKLNRILKYVKDSNAAGKIDKALRMVEGLYNINNLKGYSQENSLYFPRGNYERNNSNLLDLEVLDFELDPSYLEQFKSAYNEDEVKAYLENKFIDNEFNAIDNIKFDSSEKEFLNLIFTLIYSANQNYQITFTDQIIDHYKYQMKNYIVRRDK